MSFLDRAIEKPYQFFHRVTFGIPADHTPPLWLWVLITVITLIRLVPATYSQWEDPLLVLINEINASWKVTLGFGSTGVVHVLYCALAKILIKGTGHHYVDFVFRIPSLVAAFAVMPLGFALFSRIGGALCGTLFGICTVLLPVFTRYSVNSRAYMVMICMMLWALALTPGLCKRVCYGRLAIAYFLVGISHGLGIFIVGCFGLFGCFTGTVRHRRSTFLVNMLLTLPVYIFSFPIFLNMVTVHRDHVSTFHPSFLDSWKFVPQWFDYLFGTPVIPWMSWVYLIAIAAGVIVVFRKSWKTGIALVALTGCVPVLFGVTGNDFTLERYSMISLPFLLWALCLGFSMFPRLLPATKNGSLFVIASFSVLLLLTLPRTIDYLRYPEQDYRSVYQKIAKDYPAIKTVFGLTPYYSVGLGYYAEQFGLHYRIIDRKESFSDSTWQALPVRCIIVTDSLCVKPELRKWLDSAAIKVVEYKGNALPTSLHVSFNNRTK